MLCSYQRDPSEVENSTGSSVFGNTTFFWNLQMPPGPGLLAEAPLPFPQSSLHYLPPRSCSWLVLGSKLCWFRCEPVGSQWLWAWVQRLWSSLGNTGSSQTLQSEGGWQEREDHPHLAQSNAGLKTLEKGAVTIRKTIVSIEVHSRLNQWYYWTDRTMSTSHLVLHNFPESTVIF